MRMFHAYDPLPPPPRPISARYRPAWEGFVSASTHPPAQCVSRRESASIVTIGWPYSITVYSLASQRSLSRISRACSPPRARGGKTTSTDGWKFSCCRLVTRNSGVGLQNAPVVVSDHIAQLSLITTHIHCTTRAGCKSDGIAATSPHCAGRSTPVWKEEKKKKKDKQQKKQQTTNQSVPGTAGHYVE